MSKPQPAPSPKPRTGGPTLTEAAPAPRKSGVNIPESQRSTTQLKLRVEAGTITQLDALCGKTWTRSDFVSALIDSETNRKARRKR